MTPLLAACSDHATSAPPAPSPTTATTGAAPSSTSTPDPSIAPPHETAQQFIRRYYALTNLAQRTGEVNGLLAVSGADCRSCRNLAHGARQIYRDGGEIRGGEDTIIEMRAETPTQWIVTLSATPSQYEERAGGPTKSFPGGVRKSRVVIAKVGGRWLVDLTEGLS